MGQRVNIQYSIELDDIQSEVDRLYYKTMKELSSISSGAAFDYVPLDLSGMEHIDKIRRKLAKIDIMLGDVNNIISGYVRFKTQPEEAEPEQSSEELEIEQLEDRIAKFKEMFDAQPNQESEEDDELSNQD
jgi:hypothetical protein